MKKLSKKIYVFTKTNRRTRYLNSQPQSELAMNNNFRSFAKHIAREIFTKLIHVAQN